MNDHNAYSVRAAHGVKTTLHATGYDRTRPYTGSVARWESPAKLTPAQRDEIGYRRDEGETNRTLATEYGVSVSTIDNCAKKPRP